MPDRELLKEARDILSDIHYGVTTDYWLRCKKMAKKIDTALADHSPDAGNMVAAEIVRKIRKEPFDEYSDLVPKGCNAYAITDTEATALIESYAAAEVIRLRKWQSEAMKLIDGCLAMPSELADRLIAEAQEAKNA